LYFFGRTGYENGPLTGAQILGLLSTFSGYLDSCHSGQYITNIPPVLCPSPRSIQRDSPFSRNKQLARYNSIVANWTSQQRFVFEFLLWPRVVCGYISVFRITASAFHLIIDLISFLKQTRVLKGEILRNILIQLNDSI
jgi:hypothetical protein